MSSLHFNAPNRINNYNNHSKRSNNVHAHIENEKNECRISSKGSLIRRMENKLKSLTCESQIIALFVEFCALHVHWIIA